ncbi:MAG: DUF2156 domain-containing protein [Candidatus Goldiibacteriota bacterium]
MKGMKMTDEQLPDFPEFTEIKAEHKNKLEEYLSIFEPEISEFNFTEMFMWRKIRKTKISMLNGNLCVSLEKNGERLFYRPFGKRDIEKTAGQLLEWGWRELGECGVFGFTEEELVKTGITDKKYEINSDRAESDYIYRAKDLIELGGRKYDGKRNHIKKFEKTYSAEMEEITRENLQECVMFQKKWYEERDDGGDASLALEHQAVNEALADFEKLSVFGALLRLKKKVIGYTLADRLNKDTVLIIAEKADHEYKGIYQALNNRFCRDFLGGYEFVNREQDTGKKGIRKAKLSYHPAEIRKKYCIKIKK